MLLKTLRAALLTTAIGLSSLASPVQAAPDSHEVILYFSDETHTHLVGKEIQSCSGAIYLSGVRTDFLEVIISTPC